MRRETYAFTGAVIGEASNDFPAFEEAKVVEVGELAAGADVSVVPE